jgi:DNA-directed RNA polymerase specialized sigma24 family protein
MLEYEGLVICTVRRWRPYITIDLADDDIAQELRIKIFRALQNYDPEYGMKEKNFVFMAMTNRVKDLTMKTKRREQREVSLNEEDMSKAHISSDPYRLPLAFTDTHNRISVMMLQGFSKVEIRNHLGLTTSKFDVQIKKMREILRGAAAEYTDKQ